MTRYGVVPLIALLVLFFGTAFAQDCQSGRYEIGSVSVSTVVIQPHTPPHYVLNGVLIDKQQGGVWSCFVLMYQDIKHVTSEGCRRIYVTPYDQSSPHIASPPPASVFANFYFLIDVNTAALYVCDHSSCNDPFEPTDLDYQKPPLRPKKP